MQYSPKLKKAAEEIKEILKRYDIAAAVVLHTPGYSEYVLEITPSYSVATLHHDRIHFKAKKEDFKDEGKRIQAISDTANMMSLLSDTLGRNALQILQVSDEFDKIVGSEHGDMGFTSHTALCLHHWRIIPQGVYEICFDS